MEGEKTPEGWRGVEPSQRRESADPSGSGGWSGEGVRDAVESDWACESGAAGRSSHRAPPGAKSTKGRPGEALQTLHPGGTLAG